MLMFIRKVIGFCICCGIRWVNEYFGWACVFIIKFIKMVMF